MMKIKYNSIKVKNITESMEFYQKIFKMEVIDEYYSSSLSVVMLTDGYMNLELIEDKDNEYGLNSIGFRTNNLGGLLDEFEAKKLDIDKENYEKMGFVSLKDPDGTTINVIEEK